MDLFSHQNAVAFLLAVFFFRQTLGVVNELQAAAQLDTAALPVFGQFRLQKPKTKTATRPQLDAVALPVFGHSWPLVLKKEVTEEAAPSLSGFAVAKTLLESVKVNNPTNWDTLLEEDNNEYGQQNWSGGREFVKELEQFRKRSPERFHDALWHYYHLSLKIRNKNIQDNDCGENLRNYLRNEYENLEKEKARQMHSRDVADAIMSAHWGNLLEIGNNEYGQQNWPGGREFVEELEQFRKKFPVRFTTALWNYWKSSLQTQSQTKKTEEPDSGENLRNYLENEYATESAKSFLEDPILETDFGVGIRRLSRQADDESEVRFTLNHGSTSHDSIRDSDSFTKQYVPLDSDTDEEIKRKNITLASHFLTILYAVKVDTFVDDIFEKSNNKTENKETNMSEDGIKEEIMFDDFARRIPEDKKLNLERQFAGTTADRTEDETAGPFPQRRIVGPSPGSWLIQYVVAKIWSELSSADGLISENKYNTMLPLIRVVYPSMTDDTLKRVSEYLQKKQKATDSRNATRSREFKKYNLSPSFTYWKRMLPEHKLEELAKDVENIRIHDPEEDVGRKEVRRALLTCIRGLDTSPDAFFLEQMDACMSRKSLELQFPAFVGFWTNKLPVLQLEEAERILGRDRVREILEPWISQALKECMSNSVKYPVQTFLKNAEECIPTMAQKSLAQAFLDELAKPVDTNRKRKH